VSWIGAWFAGGDIALAMGHLGDGLAGFAGGCFFTATTLAGRRRHR
jgi:hypothetical protein